MAVGLVGSLLLVFWVLKELIWQAFSPSPICIDVEAVTINRIID